MLIYVATITTSLAILFLIFRITKYKFKKLNKENFIITLVYLITLIMVNNYKHNNVYIFLITIMGVFMLFFILGAMKYRSKDH
ncbi:hypothetical protein PRIO_2846 [Paenibacillus riograndensis SBR5]|uniref:Uncharacterized protein n=1 Tax=Paenibacillus riograndensis SBR5 TaxID=1073571 RepID=A0A0E4H9R6_9BACL|nr:hypothetical protein PRIO_2846 [Paenibacillus riograndensis SBR5]